MSSILKPTTKRLWGRKHQMNNISVWTIGHSNRSKETFLELLKEHNIEVLVDVRSFPKSKIEHFKREDLKHWLPEYGIKHVWL